MIGNLQLSPHRFKDLIDKCVSFYERNIDVGESTHVRQRRSELSTFAEMFHSQSRTLTSCVQKRIDDLKRGAGIVLMTAHQPNFFAYSGVFRKVTLNCVLAEKLREKLGIPVVSFFGIADQDFTDDRWVKSCQLPSVQRRGGSYSIFVKLPQKVILSKTAKPSTELVQEWRKNIESWLDEAVCSIRRIGKTLRSSDISLVPFAAELRQNLSSLWDIVEDSFDCSSYSDFNAFVFSKIVNNVWGYDTVFARYSECQKALKDEFGFLLSHWDLYSPLLTQAMQMPHKKIKGITDLEPRLVPFWYHCDCGSKVKLFLEKENGLLSGKGSCDNCRKNYKLDFGPQETPNLSEIASKISARAIAMILIFSKALVPSCYVGGVGGSRYLIEAEHVAKGLKIPFPPVAVWRPHDRYLGVGQLEALLELERICTELGVKDFSSAKELFLSRISKIRHSIDEIETFKETAEDRNAKQNGRTFQGEPKRISTRKREIVRSNQLPVLCHNLKILENVSTVLNLMPSIVDYAINVGLRRTSDQWVDHLEGNGDMRSDIFLESAIDLNKMTGLFPRALRANGLCPSRRTCIDS